MNCTEKQDEFEQAILIVQEELKSEIQKIVAETKDKVKKVSEKADEIDDVNNDVAVVAGTAIGTYFGGPAGGALGATISEFLTKYFVVETGSKTVEIKIDLPQVTMVNQNWIFDLPSVTVKDSDIIFSLPDIRMKRVKVGESPHVTCRGLSCTVKWKANYIDVPEPYMKEHRIVIGIPEFSMNERKIVVGVPEIKMVTQSLSFDIPTITVKTREDIGKEIADEALEVATKSKVLIQEKQDILKERIKLEIIPKAIDMIDCFRDSLESKRQEIYNSFDPVIREVTDIIKNLKVKGVPETDDDYIKVKNNLDDLLLKRAKAVEQINNALLELEKSAKETLKALENS